ncbi:MAG: glycosyltransferase family 4 protein, partial [Anaerolineae bacterium]
MTPPVRLTLLTSSYPRFPGDGTAPFIRSIAQALQRAGHAVEVVAPYDPAVQPDPADTLPVHRFRYAWSRRLHIMGHARALHADARLRPAAYLLLPLFLLAEGRALWRVSVRQRAQAIHAHWVLPNALPAALVARLL